MESGDVLWTTYTKLIVMVYSAKGEYVEGIQAL